jgi:hypothetical protein
VIQSFTPQASNIAGLDIDLYAYAGSQDVTVNLYGPGAWTGSVLSGAPIFSSTVQDVAACSSGDLACIEFRFATAVGLSTGALHYVEVVWDAATFGGAVGARRSSEPAVNYPGGQVLCAQPCGHTSGGDILLRTYAIVPEPNTALLVGFGLLALASRKPEFVPENARS